ncbi:MAG: hypothetical protein V7782_02175 [Psychromonas sp.]
MISSVVLIASLFLYFFRHAKFTTGEKFEKLLTALLGGFLVMAVMVKFIDPFATMFATQIALSELPFPLLSKWAGQSGEISAGIILLSVLILGKRITDKVSTQLFYFASLITTIIMFVAVYVHLLPSAPAEVLPLQSKPPVMTLIIILLVGINAYLHKMKKRVTA